MPLIAWTDALMVDIAEIDADHKRLVGMLNEVYDAIQEGRGQAVAEAVVRRLIDYADTHFEREESLLEERGYPDLERHQEAHRQLNKRVLDFQAALERGTPGDIDEIAIFLKDWLTQHILTQDLKYAKFVRGKADLQGERAV